MAFVNEYASDEDVEKYGLKEIWDKYHPLRRGDYFYGRKPEWTIDHESQTYFMVINRGTGEQGNRVDTLLCLNGNEVMAGLELLERSSGSLKADPFIVAWGLMRLELPNDMEIGKAEIIDVLKLALKVYGYWGVRDQRENTVVEFDF